MTACHMLDVPVTSELTPDVFPQDSIQFIQASGPAYAALRGNYALDYWFTQTLSTDEAILPARGGNWYDNQGYLRMHYHTWTTDTGWPSSSWSWLSRVIGTTNQALAILGENIPATSSSKSSKLAELKMVRALAYFMMVDLYGNVPIDTAYGDFEPRANSSRTEVFNFIESEVNAALPFLSEETGTLMYGRCNKWMAYALLAKMYLNAEVYTGTKRNDECIAACDKIISSGKYGIESMSSYLQMFYPTNGPQMKEFIFAIPYDPTAAPLANTNGYMYRARYDVPRSMRAKFKLPFTPSAPESTLPEFYAHFNDENDVRNGQWLTGKQYNTDGTPLTVTTTKKGYDETYAGTDGDASYTYQVELSPEIVLRRSVVNFDLGNDEIAWNMGYRNIKFYPDASSANRNQNNDMPVFRYSDILLMKAEAILRGGAPTSGHTALSLVNQVRANRTTSSPWTAVTLDDLYEERSREFAYEAWHRNDMIRFGKYEDSWGFKTNADTYRRIFPIPVSAIVLNPKLVQNPGY
ncbi:RagB/SusD family nutrient uptake outer membrane protein [Xanthocytophaga agilis]|uniref:RagB/SusD family nutrient uptake outer membrane protein n=1 Tax=Xanthocytophaga agilis TaxID=3048010 RepID=A0AAE3UDS2_9BACT|nr:RagB/SusD family nutrient uptake outer membrane protein [Xanthocytophaga agilis]MDJ1501525.1 RagB/SusD family nutrient uptake outer membrane protein [Xanthocytophaga agilis]